LPLSRLNRVVPWPCAVPSPVSLLLGL